MINQGPASLPRAVAWLSAFAFTLFIQTTFADNWTSNSLPFLYALKTAMSADGSVIITASGDNGVYVSTNYGTTWVNTPQTITRYGGLAVCSADGKKVFVSNGTDHFPCSTNSGQSWFVVSTNAPSMNNLLAASAEGNVLLGGSDSGLFTSTNGGAAWVTNFTGAWQAAACSADGRKLLAASGFPRGLLLSTNSGLTWRSNTVPFYTLSSVICSADGNTIVAGNPQSIPPVLVVSTNGGLTWRTNAAPSPYNTPTLAGSADLHKLVYWLGGGLSYIYTSTNFGASWVTNSPPLDYWVQALSSADGNRVLAFKNRNLWASVETNQPVLAIQRTTDSARISWIVPSLAERLQVADDFLSNTWLEVTNVPVLNTSNLNYEVTSPVLTGRAFFRLHTTP
jgi:hypothetical protein